MKISGFLLAVAFLLSVGLSGAYGYQKDSKEQEAFRDVQKTRIMMADTKADMKKEGEKYQKEIQKKLSEYKKKIKQMEAKGKNFEGKAKDEAKEAMEEMKGKMAAAEGKLKSMKSATGEAWDKMKSEVDSAMESVEESYKKLEAHFK